MRQIIKKNQVKAQLEAAMEKIEALEAALKATNPQAKTASVKFDQMRGKK